MVMRRRAILSLLGLAIAAPAVAAFPPVEEPEPYVGYGEVRWDSVPGAKVYYITVSRKGDVHMALRTLKNVIRFSVKDRNHVFKIEVKAFMQDGSTKHAKSVSLNFFNGEPVGLV